MPNHYNNFSYVIDSSFQPFSMQEMLVPLQMYKDEYDKTEAAYTDLSEKSDKFKYLSETLPEGSKARQLYEGYANELSKQAEDLAKHGLSMNNRRSLTNLKRRYQGEIGRLIDADTAMQEERKLRRQMNAKDSSMLYADENLSIDSFLDGNTPNLYNISGTELYTRGAAAGKSASSRIYNAGDEGSTLNGYYRKWVERNGYSKESMDAFRANASAIPELQQAADAILAERGALDNLSGINLERARQSVLNGIIDGAVYQEKINPVRDPEVMSAAEKASDSRARQSLQLQKDKFDYEKATSGIKINKDGTVTYDPTKDAAYQRMIGLAKEGGIDGYTINPTTGKYVKDTESAATAKKEQNAEDKKGTALMKLDRSTLANKNGFDVAFGNDRHHYDWIGALSNHGDKWYSGKAGQDNPGHNFPGAWGWASTSNVENWWGNFTYEPGDNAKMRILSHSEIQSIMGDSQIAEHINQQLYESGYYNNSILSALMKSQNITKEKAVDLLNKNGYKYTNDVQVVAVANEWPNKGEENYLVAVRTK